MSVPPGLPLCHRSPRLAAAENRHHLIMASHVSLLRDIGLLSHALEGRDLARELIAATLDPGPLRNSASADKAIEYLFVGRPWLAIRRLRALARSHPDLPDLQYILALALDMSGARLMAIDQYRHVLALCPSHPYALCHLGMVLEAEGKSDEAIVAYRHALAVLPGRVRLRAYIAQFLINALDGDAALKVLEPALPQLKCDPEIQFLWGQALALAQRFEESAIALIGSLRTLIQSHEYRPDISYPENNIPRAEFRAALIATLGCLDRAGLVANIAYGTLLGLVRDKDFIPYDTDIDFMIDAAISPADIYAAFAGDSDFVAYSFRDMGPHAEQRAVITFFYRSIAIDFFRFFPDLDAPEFLWCGIASGGRLLRFQHRRFELAREIFCGAEVWVPEKPEQFLNEAYGPNWAVPDPFFPLWASPNLMGDFDTIGRNLAISSIFTAIYYNQIEKALKYCAHARSMSENHELFDEIAQILDGKIN